MGIPVVGRVIDEFNVAAYGATNTDQTLLDLGYVLLPVAQLKYPAATALTDKPDWCAWQGAINAAFAAGGGDVKGAAKPYYTNAKITQKARVSCYGVSNGTYIYTDSVAYDGWEVNTGVVFPNNVVTSGIHVKGPNAPSLANEASLGLTAAWKYNNSTQCRSYQCSGSNYALVLDMVNNNYNCAFTHLSSPRFSSTIYGVYLRNGGNSGSDIYFYNPQIHGMRACWVMDGGGGGYYIYGGQSGAGNLLNATDDNTGVIMFNRRLADNGSSGTLAQVLFDGHSIEGWHYNWGIRGFQKTNATFRNVSFQATETNATKAHGLLKGTNLENSRIVFDACESGGGSGSYYATDPFVVLSGNWGPVIAERDWRVSYGSTGINANGRVISGFGELWGLLQANSITSGRAEQRNAYMSDGRWWRKSTAGGVFEWSDDPNAATWKQIGTEAITIAVTDEVTAFTAGTNKATFRLPYAFRLISVRASLSTAQAGNGPGGILTIDVNENGASVLGTKLTIDNTEKTSTTAATAATVTDTTLADDAEITIDIDQVGDGSARGLKVTLIGYRN